MADDLDWFGRIGVTNHALERARERLGWRGTDPELRERVRVEVRLAILSGRVAARRPNWTYATGRNGNPPEPQTRYVWDDDVSHCWVLTRRVDGLTVRTLLASGQMDIEAADARRLRVGMRRV